MLTCAKCGHEGPPDDFPPNKRTKSGRSSWCRGCQNEATKRWRVSRTPERVRADREKARDYARANAKRSRERMRAREAANREYVQRIKLERGCEWCGRDHLEPYRLHFHHRDKSTKAMNVAAMMSLSRERIDAEIAKCDVICGICHSTHHYREKVGVG